MSKNDGGLAFPFACQGPTTGPEFYYGMTLRDYFFAAALQGLCSNMSILDSFPRDGKTHEYLIEQAAKLADLAITEREE